MIALSAQLYQIKTSLISTAISFSLLENISKQDNGMFIPGVTISRKKDHMHLAV